jgi:hypothetical protein
MWKKTFLASAVTGLLASAAIIIQPTSAVRAVDAVKRQGEVPGRPKDAQGI